MAKANLPVNFKDDILKENMNGKRRFKMIQNTDGTVSFEDVTDYKQVGSTFGAAQINATNEAVNNAADASKIIDSLETIKANTQSGYIAGALAVKELSSNLGGKIIKLGTFTASSSSNRPPSYMTKNFDISNYGDITVDNVFITLDTILFQAESTAGGLGEYAMGYVSKSINNQTLKITVPCWIEEYNGYVYVKPTVSVYIVK